MTLTFRDSILPFSVVCSVHGNNANELSIFVMFFIFFLILLGMWVCVDSVMVMTPFLHYSNIFDHQCYAHLHPYIYKSNFLFSFFLSIYDFISTNCHFFPCWFYRFQFEFFFCFNENCILFITLWFEHTCSRQQKNVNVHCLPKKQNNCLLYFKLPNETEYFEIWSQVAELSAKLPIILTTV